MKVMHKADERERLRCPYTIIAF